MALIQIKGIEGGRDRRGLISLGYNFLIEGATEIEAITVPLPGLPFGLPEVDRKITEWINNSSFMIKAQIEGILNEPSEDQDQFLIQGEWREEPIEAFPDREALERDYGAFEDPDSGRLKFPDSLELKVGGKKKSEKNPLFGLTTYPVQRQVASHSYVRTSVPQSIYTSIGDVVTELPAGFDAPSGKTWIIDPPIVRKRGNCREIIRRYKDVDKLEHIKALYLLLQKK